MRENILFIVTDDQRYDTISSLGNPDISTTNMDWLVAQGTTFTQAHIPCATSGAVCMPSRAMLHSGRTLFHLEKDGVTIPNEHALLGEVLQTHGYDCFGTGKWHNGTESFSRSFNSGDNIFFGGMWDHWNLPVSDYDPTGQYDNEVNVVMNFTKNRKTSKMHYDRVSPGIHSTELITNTAIDYLKNRTKETPFFLYLGYLAPHDPRTMPEKFSRMYSPDKITLTPNCWEEHPFSFGIDEIRDEVLAQKPRKESEIRQHMAEYYGMISHLDEEVGRVLETLRNSNELENTMIVFLSDNGLAIGNHGLMGKQNNYDHSVRVPLIIKSASTVGGRSDSSYVYLLDIFPTICDMLNIAIPDSVEGKSFAQGMDGSSEIRGRKHLYFAYNNLIRSVKKDEFKLIEYRNYANETQLFNLSEDPYETKNLVGLPEYLYILNELRSLLQEYRAEWEDSNHVYTKSFWDSY